MTIEHVRPESAPLVIRGGSVLTPDGLIASTDVLCDGGTIRSIGPSLDLDAISGGSSNSAQNDGGLIDATGLLVLPGIVDYHGDAFEGAVMPREGSMMPIEIGLRFADSQIVQSGITTAFFSPSLSWESHRPLRTTEGAARLLDEFEDVRATLRCDAKLHLRYEIHHLEAVDMVVDWIAAGRVDLIAFNDHLTYLEERLRDPRSLQRIEHAFGATADEMWSRVAVMRARLPEVRRAVESIASVAMRAGIAMCAHDEETPETREWYHSLGCGVSEFPTNMETAVRARELSDHVVLGAPNALKGGSMYARLSARAAIECGVCSVLATDYYYPAPLHAAFTVASLGLCSFERAWDMVSRNPADAAGLHDRGTITEGARADLVLVNSGGDSSPSAAATIVAGKTVYSAD